MFHTTAYYCSPSMEIYSCRDDRERREEGEWINKEHGEGKEYMKQERERERWKERDDREEVEIIIPLPFPGK